MAGATDKKILLMAWPARALISISILKINLLIQRIAASKIVPQTMALYELLRHISDQKCIMYNLSLAVYSQIAGAFAPEPSRESGGNLFSPN